MCLEYFLTNMVIYHYFEKMLFHLFSISKSCFYRIDSLTFKNNLIDKHFDFEQKSK